MFNATSSSRAAQTPFASDTDSVSDSAATDDGTDQASQQHVAASNRRHRPTAERCTPISGPSAGMYSKPRCTSWTGGLRSERNSQEH